MGMMTAIYASASDTYSIDALGSIMNDCVDRVSSYMQNMQENADEEYRHMSRLSACILNTSQALRRDVFPQAANRNNTSAGVQIAHDNAVGFVIEILGYELQMINIMQKYPAAQAKYGLQKLSQKQCAVAQIMKNIKTELMCADDDVVALPSRKRRRCGSTSENSQD